MTSMFGFSVAGNCVMPMASLSWSAARTGTMTAPLKSTAAARIPELESHRPFSRVAFISSIQTHRTLENPTMAAILFGASEVGCATPKVVYSQERNNILVVSAQGPPQGFSWVQQALYSVPVPSGTAIEDRGIKHLFNGVAIAAAVAIAAPVWAQTGAPMTP